MRYGCVDLRIDTVRAVPVRINSILRQDLIKANQVQLHLGKMRPALEEYIYLVYLCARFVCHIFACLIHSSHAQNVNEVAWGKPQRRSPQVECGEGRAGPSGAYC